MTESTQESNQRIECKPSRDPAVRYFIMAVMLIGFGTWCALDMKNYPYVPMNKDVNKFSSWAFNHAGAAALPILGLIPLVMASLHLRSRLIADSTGIGYKGKPQYVWSEITEVDARLLNSKGYIYLYRGRQKLVLDSYKYHDFRSLVALIEQNVPADKIKR